MDAPEEYKVVIMASGRGSRLGKLTEHLNKALVPIGFKAVVSHVIDKFPKEVPIVITLHYEKETVKEYLKIAYPDREFILVEEEAIHGPGASLLAAKSHLQCPFIIATADTIVLENIPRPTVNWLGVAPVADTSAFNSVRVMDGFVSNMRDKVKCDNTHAWIGIAGVYEYEKFWNALEKNPVLIKGEVQVSNGLLALVESNPPMSAVEFSWFDTGNVADYEKTRAYFNRGVEDFDFSKTDEFLYFIGDRVVKYFYDKDIVEKRLQRAKILAPHVPEIEDRSPHFYGYKKIIGKVLYEELTDARLLEFLEWMERDVWRAADLEGEKEIEFRGATERFYRKKTLIRGEEYFKTTGAEDAALPVNGRKSETFKELMNQVPWDEIISGALPSAFHGDLMFDNILHTADPARPFRLIDWRQDFGGILEYGDRYYDLGKLLSGIIFPHQLVKKAMFRYEKKEGGVAFDLASAYSLRNAEKLFLNWAREKGYDVPRIRIIAALIFLNIAGLYREPLSHLIHHLGKETLMDALASRSEKNL